MLSLMREQEVAGLQIDQPLLIMQPAARNPCTNSILQSPLVQSLGQRSKDQQKYKSKAQVKEVMLIFTTQKRTIWQACFLAIKEKTQGEKTQNSRKKLKTQEKTQIFGILEWRN